jgi:L-histidine N-alpha-methyltransferase
MLDGRHEATTAYITLNHDVVKATGDGEPRVVNFLHADPSAERRALVTGLRSATASIAPKYFYDGLGAALYGAICELPEYYLTRTEREIFTRHHTEIATAIGSDTQFVDLGAADGAKAAAWLPLLAPSRYVAVDFAADVLRATLVRLAADFPHIEMFGVVTDFTHGLDLRRELMPGPVTFFYPGSSIGNFTPDEARSFLAEIRRHCVAAARSGLLIGVDTRKDAARLEAAYDDALGVTAAFNRNILLHVNRVLGCDFDPAAFAHLARYDPAHGRIEMYLEAAREVTVHIDARPRHFHAGERIHTENSYKYAPAQFTAMLQAAGFESVRVWQDDAGDFGVYYAV